MPTTKLSLPALIGTPPTLPPSWPPYKATFKEISRAFVDEAPYANKRSLQLELLEKHFYIVNQVAQGESVTAWINGGFLTHKEWNAPKDIDVVYFVSPTAFRKLTSDRSTALWTLSKVQAFRGGGEDSPSVASESLRSMAGFIDAYISIDSPERRDHWANIWSSVKDENEQIIPGRFKGFVEVIGNE